MHTKRNVLFTGLLVLFALASICNAQNISTTALPTVNALDFAFGIGNVAPLRLIGGPYAAGVATVTVSQGYTVSANGITFNPLSTTNPVRVGSGTSQETVTPTSVSCSTPGVYGSCSFTATFQNAHGTGDIVQTSTYGLQEAVNYMALGGTSGGGQVNIDKNWGRAGGTNATITGAAPLAAVQLADYRSSGSAEYWSMQPSTLTALAVPATLTAASVVFTATPTGTWANSAYYFCTTYVDALGGEGPCSLTYTQTPTLNYTLNLTSPAASTGAVGYRVYAGTGSLATAYLLPIAATNCTLTTLEFVMPACAIGANSVFPTAPTTTTSLKPNTQSSPTVNVNQPFPQSHTTFAYAPSSQWALPFQQHYGPFVAYGSLTAGQTAILGSVNLPTGFLNTIGRTIRVSGKVALTTVNTATLPYITIALRWQGGLTAGAPVAVCSLVPAAAGATSTQNEIFSCTMTTNAVGATAIGSVMTNGSEMLVAAAGGALLGATVDTGTAAIGSLGLFAQNGLDVIYTSTTNVTAGEQLLDLHVEVLQ